MTRSLFSLAAVGIVWLLISSAPGTAQEVFHPVDFADDVQPILRRHCYRCHGSKNQEANLQLNLRESALGQADSGEQVIVSGHAGKSLLVKRLISEDYGDVMPPDGEPLSQREIAVIRRWINDGANWPDSLAEPRHWAYQPIRRPQVSVDDSSATAIDWFINRRLQARQLQPTQLLDRTRLIRRVSLALTGVPPTPDQVRAFVQDRSDDAYEKVVDRLLQSPRYGERWAIPWLDMARYADSNGFQADQIRDNWAYRDWVIRAFNEGLPFDDFVIDQIAGDLRPSASMDQKIATGFHRMTTCNVEAGVHPEANRVNQVVDRVNTTATVFLGTTLECAQCHDHKYDPFTQQDYYRLFAYFNNTPMEVKNTGGVTWDFYGPTMDLPLSDSLSKKRDSLQRELEQLQSSRDSLAKDSGDLFQEWLVGVRDSAACDWQPVVPEAFETSGEEQFEIQTDGAVLLSGQVPPKVDYVFTLAPPSTRVTAIRVEVLTDDAIPGKGPGRGDPKRTNIILSEVSCDLVPLDATRKDATRKIGLRDATADFSQKNWDVARAIDGKRGTGWAISPQFGQPHWASFSFDQPVDFDADSERLKVTLGQYYGQGRVIGKPRISIYTGDPDFANVDVSLQQLAAKQNRSRQEQKQLRKAFESQNADLRRLNDRIAEIKKAIQEVAPETTLVMVEMDQPRDTFVMLRGNYETLGEHVQPGTPAALPPPEASERTGDRLELARWLTSSRNPLFSRVQVNRWWGELFGAGLVSTQEDFGTQGDDPSHPELLDWLASELIDSGWSMKHVHKLMVMSAAFQRSPRVTQESLEVDPNNRLLSRGPRFRMSAELVRDNALAICGLLSDSMYGPPIMPYQPDRIWRSVGRNQPTWKASDTEDRFRRGLYVVWKRAAPYPSFVNFDAPNRGSCTVSRDRSNTPLQALTLLNDPAYAEMALAFADRILTEAPSSDDDGRIAYAFRLALARDASSYERSVLYNLLENERDVLRDNESLIAARTKAPIAAMKFRTQDRRQLAAWFAVANAILNLDETMSQ